MRKALLIPAATLLLGMLASAGLAFGQSAPAPAAAQTPAPAPVVVATPAATKVQQGEYLARAGDCISCHSVPGAQPFAGGLRLNT
ncbi:MAG: cytochrome c, partial [Burkholderiales bacterium]